jgi:hypothetical protein
VVGDEVARDNKEQINSDESTTQTKIGVVQDDK